MSKDTYYEAINNKLLNLENQIVLAILEKNSEKALKFVLEKLKLICVRDFSPLNTYDMPSPASSPLENLCSSNITETSFSTTTSCFEEHETKELGNDALYSEE